MGEANVEAILLKGGLKRAKGLLAAVFTEADNVYFGIKRSRR